MRAWATAWAWAWTRGGVAVPQSVDRPEYGELRRKCSGRPAGSSRIKPVLTAIKAAMRTTAVGGGRMGLPLTSVFGKHGASAIVSDINPNLVRGINDAEHPN